MRDERRELARHIVKVHAFSSTQVDTLLFSWGSPTQWWELAKGPWFEKFYVVGKDFRWFREPLHTLGPTSLDYPENAGAISHELMKRWSDEPTTLITCCRASQECHGIFGGKRRRLGVSAAHHLGLSAVYLSLLLDNKADDWQLEDSRFLPPRGKRPDAFLGETLVDFGGCYSARRVRELHDIACEWGEATSNLVNL